MIRIALTGNKAAAKIMVANYLRVYYGFKIVGMFDGVEKIYRLLNTTKKYTRLSWDQKAAMYDALYNTDPNIWVGYLERRLKKTTNDIVIPDVRYLFEIERLKELGFILVRVTTPNTGKANMGTSLAGAAKGTLVLIEYYNRDAVRVSYSITYESREGTKRAIDHIMEQLNCPKI